MAMVARRPWGPAQLNMCRPCVWATGSCMHAPHIHALLTKLFTFTFTCIADQIIYIYIYMHR